MLSRPARLALRAARHNQPAPVLSPSAYFSTSRSSASTLSSSPASSQPAPRKTPADGARRKQTTAATAPASAPRDVPSPAFNQDPPRDAVQPLQRRRQAELDDSFVGLSGGEIFHQMMQRLGVKTIFGYSGGAILPVFDAIYNSPHFDFIVPRHEQNAGHMAEGYSRATGEVGVVVVTSGPGATNTITACQDALSDGTPLVVFCGQVPTTAIGTDAFQEADVIGISRSCTKWNCVVRSVEELPRRIKEAFEIATSGRPGPVLVDLPKNVTAAILRQSIPMSSTLPTLAVSPVNAASEIISRQTASAIERVASLINRAKKPIIYAGQGMNTVEGAKMLTELAHKAHIPVTTTLLGLGAFDEDDPLALHMLGMHGAGYANLAMQEADLIIALGARFDDRVTLNVAKFAPQAKANLGIVHFEILPKNINKIVQANEAVEGDVVTNVATLIPQVNAVDARPDWDAQIDSWRKTFPFDYEKESENGLIKPHSLLEKLDDLTASIKDKTIFTTGVGQHQMWLAQMATHKRPRSMITSGGLGTMGYGLPAAIGAKLGCPDCLVIDVDGDASIQMSIQELATAAQFDIDIKVIVLNNDEQGMVTQWQTLFYENRFAHTHNRNPDFVAVAKGMHMQARKLVKPEEMEEALKWLLESKGPALLEVVTDKKVPVLPMVPAGKGLHEFLAYDAEKEKERKALGKKQAPQHYS